MKLLVLDNYDSFTYNLVQYIYDLDLPISVEVFRNDAIALEAVAPYDAVLLSPGPGIPAQAGIMPDLIRTYAGQKPILGICLGHQAIGEAFGGKLENLTVVYHGVPSAIHRTETADPVFEGIPEVFEAGRYHSWVVQPDHLPADLEVLAEDTAGMIMAMRHREYPIWGLQFHPESVLTPLGKPLIANFLKAAGLVAAPALASLQQAGQL